MDQPGGDFFGESLGGHVARNGIGGVQAGCNYQFAGGFVVGIQGGHAWD
jgi:outer membrane immunogenic protein